MTIALVASTKGHSTDSNGFTTGSIDTSGATLLVVLQGYYNAGSGLSAPGTVSDSKGNSWTAMTTVTTSSVRLRWYYCVPSSVGSGHTFSVTGTGSYPALAVAAFSGIATSSPQDQESAGSSVGPGVGDVFCGSITPSENGELIVAFAAMNDPAISLFSCYDPAGFTDQEWQVPTTGQAVGAALSWYVQPTAGAINPHWAWDAFADAVPAIAASFKQSVGNVGAASGTGSVSGVGAALAAAVGSATGTGSLIGISPPPPATSYERWGVQETGEYVRLVPGSWTVQETFVVEVGDVEIIRPTDDISSGGWTPSTGSDLYAMLDETITDDGDYDFSATSPDDDTMEIKFAAPLASPDVDTGHKVRYRISAQHAPGTLDVKLYCGATHIKTWQHTSVFSATTYEQSLTSGEASNITDYSDLRLRFVAN